MEHRDLWKKIWRTGRGRFQREDPLARRAALKARIEACTEGGLIAIIDAGMDCDCVKYRNVSHVPAMTVIAYERKLDEWKSWLDGPASRGIARPSEEPEGSESRDLVLEAMEDGHPHVIYA